MCLWLLLNSGAGVNIGSRTYHDKIREMFPHLIAGYIDCATDGFDDLPIGGTDGGAKGPAIVAVIIYHLPHVIHGHPATISFGLADSVMCDTIVGAPFIVATKLNVSLADRVAVSPLLGSFPISMERPVLSDAPPTSASDVCSSLLAA